MDKQHRWIADTSGLLIHSQQLGGNRSNIVHTTLKKHSLQMAISLFVSAYMKAEEEEETRGTVLA